MATHIYLFIFFSLMTPNCTEMPQGWSVKQPKIQEFITLKSSCAL